MRTAELLNSIASWLESPNNEAMLLAESDEESLKIVAESCVLAAELLKKAADEVDMIEPPVESVITPESIEEIAALASALDSSGDPRLKKQASVLDELLLTIAAPPHAAADKKAAENYRIEELKKKYEQPRKDLQEYNKVSEYKKAIDKSKMTKEFKVNYWPLSARSCPEHAGAQMARIGEHIFQCELDKKTYNYETGYTLNNGEHVPGGDVSLQTQNPNVATSQIFDSREGRLGYNS